MALPHVEMPSLGLIPVMPSSHPRALPHRKMLQIFFFLLWPRSAKNGRTYSKNNRRACSEYGRSHHHGMDEPTSRTKYHPSKHNVISIYLILFWSRKSNHVEALK
jgi:hypothetical protein